MKYLFIILAVVFCSSTFAAPAWMPETMIADPSKPTTTFVDKGDCAAAGLGECFDVSKCSALECAVQVVSEDDPSKPIYAPKTNSNSCVDRADCAKKIAPVCDASGACTNYCPAGLSPFISADSTEVYCSQLLGYQKHDVKYLMIDAAKKAAHDTAKADESAKKIDRANAEATLKQYFKDWDTLSAAAKDDALKKLIKVYMRQ